MPEERTLPISAGHREFTIKVDGVAVGRENQLLAVNITKAANRISAACLVYLDGTASASDFPLSNADTFIPGKEIEILAGPGNDLVTLFAGLVIRQSLKVRNHTAPQLVVDCRHKAVKLTVGRKNAYYFNKKDSDIVQALLENASIGADAESTAVTHKQLVQYYSTDWDFLLARAESNGKLVFTGDDKVTVKAPSFSGNPVCTLQFGSTILEMDAEIDSRLQYGSVKSFTWDAAQQAVIDKEAADPRVNSPGNLGSDDLAAVAALDHFHLQHPAVTEEEAQAWADAQRLKSQMSRVCGRVKCEGIATVNPGDIVTLSGVGDRYNGNVLVTGVRHDFDMAQGWKTHIQFGSAEKWFAEEHDISAPKASALLPGVSGLQIGVVVGNEDPDGEHRVQVRMPLVNNAEDGTWARVAAVDAGEDRGLFFRPEIGDEVVLGFLNDDPRQAILLGMLHSSAKPAPLSGSDANNVKAYVSRSKMKLWFDDERKVIQMETPAGNKMMLSEEDKAFTFQDQNGNRIAMNSDGILVESAKELTLKAATAIKMESTAAFAVKGGTELKLEGASGVELSSTAITTVKGSMVQIN